MKPEFRVWYPSNKILSNPMALDEFCGYFDYNHNSCLDSDYVVMQYTGKKDKHGKKIFKGDILKDLTNYADLWPEPGIIENNRVIAPLEVYYCEYEASFRMKNDKFEYHDQLFDRNLEIIGNIYENPELL